MAANPARERQNIVWLQPTGVGSVILAMDDPRTEYAVAFAGVLLERREAMGISSQAELGRLVGVSEATAGRWERHDGHLPDAWELLRLCDVLDGLPMLAPVPLYFFGGDVPTAAHLVRLERAVLDLVAQRGGREAQGIGGFGDRHT
jgi:transcriptional regulator with XRE-family HTH domain